MRALPGPLFPLGGFPACRRGNHHKNNILSYLPTYLYNNNNNNIVFLVV